MVLLYFEKDGTIKAATIKKPDIIPRVTEVLGKTYKPELAERYAKKVADFFVTKMRFPEDGIYRLNGEGKLCRFNLEKKEWNQNDDEKSKYVINESSDFWKEFDKEFPYLLNFRKELVSMIEEQTKNMFEISPDISNSIRVDRNKFYTDKTGNYALNDVFSEYLTEKATQSIMSELLQEVFGTKSMPVFVIIDNIPQIALTESSVITDKNLESINEFLSKHFSKEDVEKNSVRVKNSILFGVNFEYQLVEVYHDSHYNPKQGWYSVLCKIAGLYVNVINDARGFGPSLYMLLTEKEKNQKILDSFKLLKKIDHKKYYEADEQGRKIFICVNSAGLIHKKINGKSTCGPEIMVSYEPFKELSE